jgi:hypothetical protein
VTLYASASLLAELHGVRKAASSPWAECDSGLRRVCSPDVPAIIPPAIIEDPDDHSVLACAVAAKADLVVSGDPHLLKLEQYEGVPIITPAQAGEGLGL